MSAINDRILCRGIDNTMITKIATKIYDVGDNIDGDIYGADDVYDDNVDDDDDDYDYGDDDYDIDDDNDNVMFIHMSG